MADRAPGLRRLSPYWYEYTTRAKTRWYGRQILEVFTTEFRDRTKEYYTWAIHNGLCTVNGMCVTPSYRIRNSDLIVNKVHRHEPAVTDVPVRILHRDDTQGRIVVVKPGSIPVHATGRYHYHTLVEMVKQQTGLLHVYTSNRLDRLTSGIMVCSTTKAAACALGNDFNAGLVNKAYVCRVLGRFPDDTIDCQEPILAVDRQSGLNIVHPRGKACRTFFARISYDQTTDTSVLLCRPVTGRTHQIRVHAQFLGHPITNDPLYNHPVWDSVDRDILASAQPRHYERVGGETGNTEIERVLTALKGARDDAEGWARWRDDVLYGTLNREMGYESVFVPGANGEPAPPPPDGVEPGMDADVCSTCRTPLLTDPKPEELYIYLHAVKYWTDAWVFEDELPPWAAAGADRRLPDLPLVRHTLQTESRAPCAALSVPRISQCAVAPMHTPSPLAQPMPCLTLDVPRGLEDVAQREILQRLSPFALERSPRIETALHSGTLLVRDPFTSACIGAMYLAAHLPVVMGALYTIARAKLPQDMLTGLFCERTASLGKGGAGHEKDAPLSASEHALLHFVQQVWDDAAAGRRAALDAWQQRKRGTMFAVVVDRSSYVFPTLSTSTLEQYLAQIVQVWLASDSRAWHVVPRAKADLIVKLTLAPRLGAKAPLHSGPRATQGNVSGTLLIGLHLPVSPADPVRTMSTPAQTKEVMARARAEAVAGLLPWLPHTKELGTLHNADPSFAQALASQCDARGTGCTVVQGDASPAQLQGAVVQLTERSKDIPHAALFDVVFLQIETLYNALAPGAYAILLTAEPKIMQRALRELENKARRAQWPTTLRLVPLVQNSEAGVLPTEDASTCADADEEARMRDGLRSFFFHHHFLACVRRA
ncbi:hypothetical protein MVES1_000194 [Malassezia vespertilionis]|uniref:uncharacterized protein n=1 Tax=Malassezia vespertilionis TaxID=2020962 RepID=UPI0024B26B7F|nr:uncharacterized protein MVES1_000194 [Malassezia vespertilionis]WFD04870.1 hypothetical protein MVES1_000194 [Malassezia vespertilionis]